MTLTHPSQHPFISKIDSLIRFFFYVLIFWLPYSSAVIEVCVVASLVLWLVKRGLTGMSELKALTNSPETEPLTAAVLDSAGPRGLNGPGIIPVLKVWIMAFAPAASPLNGPICVFLLACLCSVWGSSLFFVSLHGFLSKTLEWFIIYFLVIETFTHKKHFKTAFIVFWITAAATVLDTFYQFFLTRKDIFLGHVIGADGRATAGFNTPNTLGAYLAVAIPFWVALLLAPRLSKGVKVLLSLTIAGSFGALYLSFSRGAWISVGVSLGLLALISFITKIKFRVFRPRMTAAVGILLIGVICAIGWTLAKTRINLSELSGSPLAQRQGTSGWRVKVWKESLPMIHDRPVFGHGINTYMRLFPFYRSAFFEDPIYAHNSYLQLTVETGLVGLFSFLTILILFFKNTVKILISKRNLNSADPWGRACFGLSLGLLAFLLHSGVDTHFYSLTLTAYFWLTLGLAVSLQGIIGGCDVGAAPPQDSK